ncbi:MAG: matrixin family metalloprotease [Myxococcota bacterium]
MWRPLLLTLTLSCVSTVDLRDDRIQWTREPVIGIAETDLSDGTRWAIKQWRWGTFQSGCQGADICVRRGFLWPGASSRTGGYAEWPGQSNACDAVIVRPAFGFVIAHELGHCFGLGHSVDQRSVMYPVIGGDDLPQPGVTPLPPHVTHDDADALELVKRGARDAR